MKKLLSFFLPFAVLAALGAPAAAQTPYTPTYYYGINDLVPAAAATDIVCVQASFTKTVQILSIRVSGIATAATVADVYVIRRTTLDTGGTSSAFTPGRAFMGDPFATATVLAWTVNPAALGAASGGFMTANKLTLSTAAGATGPVAPVELLGAPNALARLPVLRPGSNDALCVNYDGGTIAGNSLGISIVTQEH